MAINKLPEDRYSMGIYVSKKVHDKLLEIAREQDRSVNYIINKILGAVVKEENEIKARKRDKET